MKLLQIIIINILFGFALFVTCLGHLYVNDYLGAVVSYFGERHVWILTHFSCFTIDDNIRISIELSEKNVQSRFVVNFGAIDRLIDTPIHSIQGFVVDLSCKNTEKIFQQEDHGIIFKDSNFWLFIDDDDLNRNVNESRTIYEEMFKNLNALPISNVFIAKKTSPNPLMWQLFDAYRVHQMLDIEVKENGVIGQPAKEKNNRNGIKVDGVNFSTYRRHNLQNITINCGLVIAYPDKFTFMNDERNSHIDIFTKSVVNLCAIVRENLNISCNILQVDSYGWPRNSTSDANDTNYDGMVGLFIRKKIQMGFNGINMRAERLKFFDFAGDLFTPRTPLLFRQPPLSAVANVFVLPLSLDVWLCIVALLLIIFLTMTCHLFHPVLRSNITMLDIGTFVWGAICQQSTHLNISNTSGRLVILTTFLATLALFTSYAASIVALLQSPSTLIKSIDDLIASPLNVYVHDSGFARFTILKFNDTTVNKVYEAKIRSLGDKAWIYDPFVGIERMRNELIAFQVDSAAAYKAIAKTYTASEKCSLSELQMFNLPMTTIPVEKNSGYKELIRQRIKWLREVGLVKRDEIRWIPKKPDCEGSRGFLSVGLAETKPAIQLLLIGYGLSLAIAVFEKIYHHIQIRYRFNVDSEKKSIQMNNK